MRRHAPIIANINKRLLKLILIIGCFVSNAFLAQANATPDWVMNPPSDNDEWFYSVGSGDSQSHAQKAALAELASRIQIKVQSSTQQFVEAKNKEVNYFLEMDNNFTSDEMNFNNIEIIRTHQDKQSIYVLTKIDRDSFFDAKYKRLLNTLSQLDIKTSTPLQQKVAKLIAYNWQKNTINNDISLLKAYNINTDTVTDRQNQIETKARMLAETLNLTLHIPENLNNAIKQPLLSWLTASGLTITKKPNGKALLFVVTELNQWLGKDKFNHVNKMEFEIAVLFDGDMIHQKYFSAQAFASNAEIAKQQAIEQLVQPLTTN